jgi:phosphoglycerate dehydrogenase-like enzyme
VTPVTNDRDGEVRVGIAYPFHEATRAALGSISPRLRLRFDERHDQAGVDAVANDDLDGLIGGHLPSDPARAPSLRWLQALSAGVELLLGDGSRPWPAAIELTNARGVYAIPIAQYTLAAILDVAERGSDRRAQQALGVWADDQDSFTGRSLRGTTLVIVGYGGIGREIARLAVAHGMRVLAVKANPATLADDGFRMPGTGDPEGTIPERVVGLSELEAIAREADFVSVNLPLTGQSRGVVSRAVLAALPGHAWIVNTGRGPVIDEAALDEVLAAGRLGGAVLDVFGEEPLPPASPLWRRPNVVITPHVAGAGATVELRALVAENLRRFVEGEPLLNHVDTERGY